MHDFKIEPQEANADRYRGRIEKHPEVKRLRADGWRLASACREQQEHVPIYTMGSPNPRMYTRGPKKDQWVISFFTSFTAGDQTDATEALLIPIWWIEVDAHILVYDHLRSLPPG